MNSKGLNGVNLEAETYGGSERKCARAREGGLENERGRGERGGARRSERESESKSERERVWL